MNLPTHQLELALGDGPGVQVGFLTRINCLFLDAETSPLFDAVSKRLAQQSASGEIAQLTAHEEKCWI